MRKYRGWYVWPCLCGFDGTYHQIRKHQRTCSTWKARDVAAVREERRLRNFKPAPGPRCPHCNAIQSHHKKGCPGSRRGPRFASKVWYAFLRAVKARYEKSGRGKKLMALFD